MVINPQVLDYFFDLQNFVYFKIICQSRWVKAGVIFSVAGVKGVLLFKFRYLFI